MNPRNSALTYRRRKTSKPASLKPAVQSLRRYPVGAELLAAGGVGFRIWASKCRSLKVLMGDEAELPVRSSTLIDLQREDSGYFSGMAPAATAGMFYKFQTEAGTFPDPASRFQPDGPHGPSQIIDPTRFSWTDDDWPGITGPSPVIYEMHIGTFTKAGTWASAAHELPELARLGVTLLEVMPVADFSGRFGWGYDGVDLFAPTRLYGSPDDFRAFVDQAHNLGLGVILDVVYNHFGPDGNYIKAFSDDYGTDRYANEWGEAINFDGPNSGPVREFFAANAAYWIDEFHLDGLRLDATQQIFDASEDHVLALIAREARRAANGKPIFLVAENEPQQARLIKSADQGGYGLDAMWNDDFHHTAMAALTGRNEAYFSDHKGAPQEFISALKWGFLFQGQWYSWQEQRRGTPALGLPPTHFVTFLQNHDQVANSLRGLRGPQLTSPGRWKALTALVLLAPSTPMLFQGQEFGASSPFLYFADHNQDLAPLVAKGRKEFLQQFETIACAEAASVLSDPAAEQTFLRSKLDFSERETHSETYALHRDLLRLRREDPVFSHPRTGGLDGAVLGPEAFVLRFFSEDGKDRLLLINLGLDLDLTPAPEPLLAPPGEADWSILWSSEAPCYGGGGTPPLPGEGSWRLLGHAALVLQPRPRGDS